MEFNFEQMQAQMAKELASEESKSSSFKSEYPTVYVGKNGKLKLKLLINKKMGGLQRRIIRHPADSEGKTKVPCLSQFVDQKTGKPMACPICEAIKSIEQAKGKEIAVFRKYGYAIRGICYAQIIDHDATYFTEENSPRKKDVILLMYPKTVYDQMNHIMVDAGPNIKEVLGTNTGIPVIVERTQKGKDPMKFTTSFDAFNKVSSFDTEAEFEALLDKLPDLNEQYYPTEPTDEIITKVEAVAQAITQEYLGSAIVNPSKKEETSKVAKSEPKKEVDVSITQLLAEEDDDVPFEITDEPAAEVIVAKTETPVATDGKPDCFGKHDDSSNKCSMCIHECDCVLSSEL